MYPAELRLIFVVAPLGLPETAEKITERVAALRLAPCVV
jgi:hypothetical protein